MENLPVPDIDFLDGFGIVFGIPEAPPGPGGLDGWGGARAVGGDIPEPIRINAPEPRYTEEARQARIQCMVILRAVVDEEGDVVAVEAIEDLPLGLTESAIDTVKTWKYEPATQNGSPVSVHLFISVSFRLVS